MFNNKEFNAKLSVKLTNLVKTGSNATILKQLINGVQNAVTVGLKNDVGVINAINQKYTSGNPEAFLKLAQGDSLALLSRGYKTIANGKNLSKLLSEEIASTKLELVKASVLYVVATGGKFLSKFEKEEADKSLAALVATLTAFTEAKAEAEKAEAEAEKAEAEAEKAEAEAEKAEAEAEKAEAEAEKAEGNSLNMADILAAVESMDDVNLAALSAAIAKREASIKQVKPLRKARKAAT